MRRKYKNTIQNIRQMLAKKRLCLAARKRLVVFSVMMVPVTSLGAGMTIYVDNSHDGEQKMIVSNDTVINLDENITINFAQKIHDTDNYEKSITIFPRTQARYFWGNDGQRLTIVPTSIWKPKTEYSLIFPHNTYDDESKAATFFGFETVAYPSVVRTNIVEGQPMSEDDEIVVSFDRPIERFDVHVVARPFIETEQYFNADDQTLRVTLKQRSQNISDVHTLTVFAKHKKQDNSRFFPIDALSFSVVMPEPEVWPKQHIDRMEIARKTTAPQITEGKYIDVNLDAQITTLFEDGVFVKNFVTSTGAKDTPTPTGRFQIYNKHPYALSEMFQVYLPYWMAFTEDGKYGFHDLVVWPEGHEEMPSGGKESTASIGNAVSPGCVRHDAKNSQFLYEWTEIGTPVVIY